MEVGDGELCQFILKGVRDDGVKSGAEVYKQDPHISPWSVQMLQDEVQSQVDCIIHWQMEVGMESWVSLGWKSYGMMVLKA